jgi:predicted nuclease of restriction endonuclease-like RecB superfamily
MQEKTGVTAKSPSLTDVTNTHKKFTSWALTNVTVAQPLKPDRMTTTYNLTLLRLLLWRAEYIVARRTR